MCDCEHLHVGQLGPLGKAIADWAWYGLEAATAKNGARPRTLEGFTQLLELLAACPSATPERASFLLNVPAAASLLGVSRQHVRWLADRGRFPGATKIARDWLIPRQDVEAYRRTRRAA